MTENKEFIYGLFFEGECFYVGRSGRGLNRSPGVRFKEHQAHARHDTTPVYTFIREQLNAYDIPWREEILCWCSDDVTVDDSEFFWVIKMMRDGHQLYNAKNGDAKMLVNASEAANSGFMIESPKDIARYKKFKLDLIQAKRRKNALRLQLKKEASKEDFLEAKVSKKDLFATIKRAETPSQKMPDVPVNNAQEAFDAGKYTAALNYLGGSYTKFAEQFGIAYLECI